METAELATERTKTKYQYSPIGDGTTTFEDVNAGWLEKLKNFSVDDLLELAVNRGIGDRNDVHARNFVHAIVNELLDRPESDVKAQIAEAKTFLNAKDRGTIGQIESLYLGAGANGHQVQGDDRNATPTTTTRTYLNCPYKEKENCKRLGAHWDSNRKQWYYEGAELPEGLKKYTGSATSDTPATSGPRYLRCRSCGQSGHTGGYPFSTLPGSGRCDDCV